MINVLNKYHGHTADGERNISIMRTSSALGNPYSLKDGYSREQALKSFRIWLDDQIECQNPKVIQALDDIGHKALTGDVNLICCCKPAPCHGDIIKEVIEKVIFDVGRT